MLLNKRQNVKSRKGGRGLAIFEKYADIEYESANRHLGLCIFAITREKGE